MIRKTISITSIAILVAAISVATTMTMIQADNDSDVGALFGPDTGQLGVTLNPILGGFMEHFYADVTGSTAAVGFSSAASLSGGFLDASEPSIQSGVAPANPIFIPGLVLWANVGTCIPVTPALDVYKGFEESVFTFDSLTAGNLYEVTVDISDMDDFGVFTEGTCTTPALETVFVTANTVELGSVVADIGAPTGALKTKTFTSQVERANGIGDMTVGFNQLFSWDPIGTGITGLCDPVQVAANGCIGLESGIRVEQITLVEKTGVIMKIDTCPDEIEIREIAATSCTFTITYTGDSANIRDTVPAEWDVTGIVNNLKIDAVLTFTDAPVIDGILALSEVVVTTAGTNVPDGVFDFGGGAMVVFTDTGDKSVQFDELTLGAGGAAVADGTATLEAEEQCEFVVKGNSAKGATKINCDNVTEVDATVSISTRESPDTKKANPPHSEKADKFKPTSCVPLAINDGAVAILVDSNGDVVLTGDPAEPAVLDETGPLDPILVVANDDLAFECE